jgi:hypothetical protein
MSSWYDSRFPKPEMTEEEFSFLASHLTKDDIMIEYGSGHSTPNLAPRVKELWSIEHHPVWHEKVLKMCEEYDNVKHVLIELDEPRIAPADWHTKPEAKYGYPTPFECVKSYSTWILTQTQKFDKVLLDGRGRQWVAQFIMNNLNPNHDLFVHDYIDRERYFIIEKFYDKVEVVGCMAKFKCRV